MRVNINLASQPYQDVRRFIKRWGTLALAFAVVSCGLAWYAVHSWQKSRNINREISQVESQIQVLETDRKQAEELLAKPENKEVSEDSHFLNQLIARKSFSWTRVFMELEQIMPPGLHVVSILPQLTPDNQLGLRLTVAGTSRDRALDLVKELEKSPVFVQPELRSELMLTPQAQSTDTVQFEISAVYVPKPISENTAKPEGKGKKSASAESKAQPKEARR